MTKSSNANNKDQAITARKALICSLLYIIAADGEADPQEIGNLLSITGGEKKHGSLVVGGDNPEHIQESFDFVKTHPAKEFLNLLVKTDILNKKQKLFILTHMLDISLSDGKTEDGERELIFMFQEAFGISDDEFKPYYETVLFKNDRSIFI